MQKGEQPGVNGRARQRKNLSSPARLDVLRGIVLIVQDVQAVKA